jgi:preprotein translocase SecE subunit
MAEAKKKEKAKVVKETKKEEKVTKKVKKDVKKKDKKEKKSLWTRFRIFCHGVKSETLSVHWPNKKDMIKYSIATIVFIVFCSLFFYAVEIIFALIQALFN